MPFAGGAPQGTPVFADTAGAAAIEGTIVSSPYLSNDVSDASKKFAEAYKAAYNEDAELHGAKAYDGTQILLTAMKASNVGTGKALADAIRATKYKGLLGDFAYDDTGVGIFATSIGVITGGKLNRSPADRRPSLTRRHPRLVPASALGEPCRSFFKRSSAGSVSARSMRSSPWVSRSSTAPWAWSTSHTVTW